MIASAVSTAVAITTKLQSMFSVTCGQGYRRGVNVIVGNMLSHPITDLGHY